MDTFDILVDPNQNYGHYCLDTPPQWWTINESSIENLSTRLNQWFTFRFFFASQQIPTHPKRKDKNTSRCNIIPTSCQLSGKEYILRSIPVTNYTRASNFNNEPINISIAKICNEPKQNRFVICSVRCDDSYWWYWTRSHRKKYRVSSCCYALPIAHT